MRLLLLAPPGAGKGTQGVRLAEHYKVTHISSGDLLREHLRAGDELGRRVQAYLAAGDLVPDKVMNDLLQEPILKAVAHGGFVLDGYPRTIQQAQLAYEVAHQLHTDFQVVIFLDVPDDVLVGRLLARGRGADDTEDTIRHRLEVYHDETEPLIAFYESRGIVRRVNGDQPIEDVTVACVAAVDDLTQDLTSS
jgi:adenylate kinase